MTHTNITDLAAGIAASMLQEQRDGYDRACKRLLSEKPILGWILHECLDEYKDVDPLVIANTLIEGNPEVGTAPVHADDVAASRIVGIDTEDASLSEGTVRYDIRFSVLLPDSQDRITMMVNVEAQGIFHPGYSLLQRGSYYCARMISSQFGRTFARQHYERLQKACSIWVCPNPPRSFRNTVTRYSMTEQNLVGHAHADRSSYDLMEMVLVCPDGDLQSEGDGILRLLGTLIASDKDIETRKSILSNEFGIPMSEQLAEEVSEVGSFLSKGLEDRAYARGLDAGIADGIEQGMQQGIAQGIEQGLQQGIEQGLQQGIEQGLQQGIEQGLKQGIEQGVQQGMEQGLQQGIEQGRRQGVELGAEQERSALSRLFEALQEQGRIGEFEEALRDDVVRRRLVAELGLTEGDSQ